MQANYPRSRLRRARITAPTARRNRKPVVLFLAANPRGTRSLELMRECADVQRELARALAHSGLRFEARWAVSVDDAMRYMTELDPVVVHLSGHGEPGAAILLESDRGEPQPVTAQALAMMIAAGAPRARAIVVNACFGLAEATELLAAAECVIGCNGPIEDDAARAFAVRFYAAVAAGRSIGNAAAHGAATLFARRLSHADLPRCVTRNGVDASSIVLTASAPTAAPSPRG